MEDRSVVAGSEVLGSKSHGNCCKRLQSKVCQVGRRVSTSSPNPQAEVIKARRAISLARPRPLCSDFRRSVSASESQLWFSPNHAALTNLRSLVPRSSQITVAARTFSLPSLSSRLARASLPILEDDCLSALSSGRSLFR